MVQNDTEGYLAKFMEKVEVRNAFFILVFIVKWSSGILHH